MPSTNPHNCSCFGGFCWKNLCHNRQKPEKSSLADIAKKSSIADKPKGRVIRGRVWRKEDDGSITEREYEVVVE